MSVALWQLMGGQDPQTLIRKALARMKEEGIVRIAADYSGGNDEGGINTIRGFNADDKEVELPSPWSTDDREYDENTLWAIADDILGTHFGTWAGEFYAYGTMHIDPSDERTCWREGTYEQSHGSDDSDVF